VLSFCGIEGEIEYWINFIFYNEERLRRGRSCERESAVPILAVSNFQNQQFDFFILDIANQTVAANAVSPKPLFVAMKRLTPLPWILSEFEPLTQKTNDELLGWTVELFDLPFSGPGNRPD
jgi:hypothetical protein